VLDMGPHGVHGDVQPRGDLPIGVVAGQLPQQLLFPVGSPKAGLGRLSG
jgi:hypothetical protein